MSRRDERMLREALESAESLVRELLRASGGSSRAIVRSAASWLARDRSEEQAASERTRMPVLHRALVCGTVLVEEFLRGPVQADVSGYAHEWLRRHAELTRTGPLRSRGRPGGGLAEDVA